MKRSYRIYGDKQAGGKQVAGKNAVSAAVETTGPDRYQVEIDGQTFDVQFREVDSATVVLQFADGRILEVPYYRDGKDVHVGMRSQNYKFEVLDQMQAVLKERSSSGAGSDGALVSQMPGRVIKVSVKEGDSVEVGQGLVIMEAMKMENELKAPVAGKVVKVNVVVGQTVETGVLLVRIEPAV